MQTASATHVAQILEAFIRERFQVSTDDRHFNQNTDLWDEGYVDSLGIVELIEFVKRRFDVSVPNELLFDPDFVRISGMARRIAGLAGDSATAA